MQEMVDAVDGGYEDVAGDSATPFFESGICSGFGFRNSQSLSK
jgi:hypothetical protein